MSNKIREAAKSIYPLAKFTNAVGGCIYDYPLEVCRTYDLCDKCDDLYQEEITRIMGIIEGVQQEGTCECIDPMQIVRGSCSNCGGKIVVEEQPNE